MGEIASRCIAAVPIPLAPIVANGLGVPVAQPAFLSFSFAFAFAFVMTLILSVRSGTLVHTCTSIKDYMAGQVREQMREKREKHK